MAKDNSGPAFPYSGKLSLGGYPVADTGMTIRDWFATKALPIAAGQIVITSGFGDDKVAERAYAIADAMLAERSK